MVQPKKDGLTEAMWRWRWLWVLRKEAKMGDEAVVGLRDMAVVLII